LHAVAEFFDELASGCDRMPAAPAAAAASPEQTVAVTQ
jgi:hypothetical protein